jgi:hypothetical protein
MLRAEFPVHRKRVLKRDFCIFIGIDRGSGAFLFSSIRSGRGHSDYCDKVVMAIVGALAPEVYEIDAQEEQRFLMELVNKHEGRLTAEVFKGYRKLAQRMNQERIGHEKELKKLQGKS